MRKLLPSYIFVCMGTARDTLVQYEQNMEKIRKVTNEVMTGLTWFI